ncbi:MAG TPA: dNTP triphosphohydrolase [Pyrinomonadaceae bacterium]|nr:dNTP triphosphohydrolase [Pyrinomonadaceae bacterium]
MLEWKHLLNKDRLRKSTVSGDPREEFERDYDRSVFSTPVKRLQDKTQVFPLETHDAVRTRLTHSLEVCSLARGLTTSACKWLRAEAEIEPGVERQIEAIAATCGLIHDLGNPPFGHAGERAIRGWFEKKFERTKGENGKTEDPLGSILEENDQLIQDFRNFEGNAQTLRLVSKLQILADFYGLNLTFGTLSAASKYIVPSNGINKAAGHAKSKPGYFASENDLVQRIREETGTGAARNPITFLVEAADDIVYSVADLEDGIKKGVITWSYLEEQLHANDGEGVVNGTHRILKAATGTIPDNLHDDIYGTAFRSAAIAKLASDAVETFTTKYQDIMNGSYFGELVSDGSGKHLIDCLQSIGTSKVYRTPSTLKLELMGRKIISDLMDIFWEGARHVGDDGSYDPRTFDGKVVALISENYRRVFCNSISTRKDLPEAYHRLQLVTDYVCGMTDSFARDLHSELFNG